MDVPRKRPGPSEEAIAKFTDYLIPYITDESADAATKSPELKLLFRLAKFTILDEDASELEWCVPAALIPSALQSILTIIDQFLENPIDLDGKMASKLLSKKRRRRRRRRSLSSGSDSDGEVKKKKEKKKKEKEQYKSAALIADSDVEDGDLEAFLEKEKALRDRVSRNTEGGRIGTMKATGTKKRRKKVLDKGEKKRKGNDESAVRGREPQDLSEASDLDLFGSRQSSPTTGAGGEEQPRPRPRPRPRPKKRTSTDLGLLDAMPLTSDLASGAEPGHATSFENAVEPVVSRRQSPELGEVDIPPPKRKGRLVVSDDEE